MAGVRLPKDGISVFYIHSSKIAKNSTKMNFRKHQTDLIFVLDACKFKIIKKIVECVKTYKLIFRKLNILLASCGGAARIFSINVGKQ